MPHYCNMLLTKIKLNCHRFTCIMYNIKNYVNIGGVMLKNRIFRLLSVFCSIVILMSCLTFSTAVADEPVGKMAAVYAYVLNNYLYTYSSMHTENAGDSLSISEDNIPNGVVYSDIVNFDANENPYLVIFLADSGYTTASCHVWKYDEETENAERIAILDVNYNQIPLGQSGVFSLGSNAEKRYITYKVFEGDELVHADYYTVIDGDAFEYVNAPQVLSETGVMDFSSEYFHPNVDVSHYNQNIGNFFDKLKRTHYVRPFTGFHQYLSGIPCGSASPAGSSAAVMSGRCVSIKFTPLRMSSASVLGSSVHRLMVNSPACRHAETSRSDKSFGSARRPNRPVVCAALTSASTSLGRLGSSPMICKSGLADATRAASTSPRPMMIVSSRQSAYRSVIRSCRSMV